MTIRRLALAMALALLSTPVLAADDSKLTDDQKTEAMDFAMHDAVFTLYHESGHLLIHELKLPVLGKEEDAADSLGVIEIFRNTKDEDELYNTMLDVSDGWYYSSLKMTDDDIVAYDDHSLDIQRANAMVCMMVGANRDVFNDIADDYQFDDSTKDGCAETWQQANDSWDKELKPYLAKVPGSAIPITYKEAGQYAPFADELKSRGILEGLAETLRNNFALPGPVSVTAQQCNEPNAYYDPNTHQIVYCYELAQEMYQRGVDNLFSNDSSSEDQTSSGESTN